MKLPRSIGAYSSPRVISVLILLLGLIITTYLVKHFVLDPRGRAAELQNVSALSDATLQELNLHNLSENEFAVIKKTNGKKLKKPMTKTIQLSDGQTLTYQLDTESTIEVIEGKAGINTYLPANLSDVTIHSRDELTEAEAKEPIDPGIERKFSSSGNTVPVIIQFNLPFDRFYELAQDNAGIADKLAKFNEIKQKVTGVLTEKAKLKSDLKIINGVSADVDQESFQKLVKSPFVKKIELDRQMKAFLDTSVDDIKARSTWGIYDVNNNSLTGVGKVIAVIDTGVDYTHPDLGGCIGSNCKVLGGHDYYNNDNDPMDDQGHGTHVAATAAGKGIAGNGQQLWGVAPDAKILAYKVLGSDGSGPSSAIVAAMNAAVDPNGDGNPSDHVDVATLSIGGSGSPDDSMSLAVDKGSAAGVVFTIAAGNSGPNLSTVNSPGVARSAITVAAACKTSQIGGTCTNPIANFSSRGPVIWGGIDLQKPDIAAPGVLICAARWGLSFPSSPTCFDDKHMRISGTSMATPHMAGAAALVRQANPSWTPQQVKDWLKNTARDLGGGMTYNDQGKGEVDLLTAIPFSAKALTTPSTWDVSTDPSKKLSTVQQSFTVTSSDSIITSLSISTDNLPPGVTITQSKQTLQVANKTSDSFTATLTVDNDVAANGRSLIYIYFSENGAKKAGVPIFLTIKPTFNTTSDLTLDYGNSDPSINTWTSQPITVTINNYRTDTAQTIALTSTQYPSGITFQSPQNVTIPIATATKPGTGTVSTSVTVDNTKVASNFYYGSITLKNANMAKILSTKFSKFYLLTFQDSTNPSDFINNAGVNVIDGVKNSYYAAGSNPNTIYLPSPGVYQADIAYRDPSNLRMSRVFKENIQIDKGLTALSVSKSEAKYAFNQTATDENGNTFSSSDGQEGLVYVPNPAAFSTWSWNSGAAVNGNMFSSFSSNFKYHQTLEDDTQPLQIIHKFFGATVGMQNAVNITNNPSDLKKIELTMASDQQTGGLIPVVYGCINLNVCAGGWMNNQTLSQPVTQTLYSNFPSEAPYYFVVNNSARTVTSPEFSNETPPNRWFNQFGRTPLLPRPLENKLYTGLGPTYPSLRLTVNPFVVSLDIYPSSATPYYAYLLRQDFSVKNYSVLPYTLWRNGTQYASGTVPASGNQWIGYGNHLDTPGVYEYRMDIPYKNRGIDLTGKIKATFDSSSTVDRNPPSIKRLYYYSGSARSEVYDPSVTNKIDFEFDPIGGSMNTATASYSTDNGGTFQPLSVTSGQNGYTAVIPQLTNVSKLTLEIKGTDVAGNSLSYTFQLPQGQASQPPQIVPTTLPTAMPQFISITSPLQNSVVTKGAITPITVNASSPNPIVKVNVYQFIEKSRKSALICTDTTAPYSCDWKVPSSGGSSTPYQLYAYMYSANGFVAGSAYVSVTAK